MQTHLCLVMITNGYFARACCFFFVSLICHFCFRNSTNSSRFSEKKSWQLSHQQFSQHGELLVLLWLQIKLKYCKVLSCFAHLLWLNFWVWEILERKMRERKKLVPNQKDEKKLRKKSVKSNLFFSLNMQMSEIPLLLHFLVNFVYLFE